MHATRRAEKPSRRSSSAATRLECWRVGWTCGAQGSKTAQAQELASTYFRPADFLQGWREGRDARDEADEAARQRIMA